MQTRAVTADEVDAVGIRAVVTTVDGDEQVAIVHDAATAMRRNRAESDLLVLGWKMS